MKKRFIQVIRIFALCSIAVISANAQNPILTQVDPPAPAGNNPWGNVVVISQDQQGYIWLATTQGLHRYDGHNYVSYYNDPEDSTSMAENRIVSMCISKSGIIWLGLWTHGLDRFDPVSQTFTHFSYNSEDI